MWCGKSFKPHPRLKERQKSCGDHDCKRQQKRLSQRLLQKLDPDYKQSQRDWRAHHPGYWKAYRQDHPAYAQRNRIQSKIRWRQLKLTLQNRIDILELHENIMKPWYVSHFAKRPRSIHPMIWAYSSPHETSPSFESYSP